MENDNTNEWSQTLTLKDRTGNIVSSYTWNCSEDDQSNTDGFTDAYEKFAQDSEFRFDYDEGEDEIFDTLVIDQKSSWTDGNWTIEISPVGRL